MLPVIIAALLATKISAQDSGPLSFCTDTGCIDNCPSSITFAGTGFPACVVYRSTDIFQGGGYADAPNNSGGYQPYVDYPEATDQCVNIVRTQVPESGDSRCGIPASFSRHAACRSTVVQETFAVQFCCGTDDCRAANVGDVPLREMGITESSAVVKKRMVMKGTWARGLDASLKFRNGTVIKPLSVRNVFTDAAARPASVGTSTPFKVSSKQGSVKARVPVTERRNQMFQKRADCKWTENGASYTRTADNTQNVTPNPVSGGTQGVEIMIGETREQSWSTTVMAGLTFEVFSAGASYTTEESISHSNSITFPVPPNTTGFVGFTALLTCSMGTYSCNDGTLEDGEACTPTESDAGDDVRGYYGVITGS